MSEISIVPLDQAEFTFAPRPWSFAEQRRAEIEAHFAARLRTNPGMWNGRVLLAHEYSLRSRNMRAAFLETDFASFIAWCDWDFPDRSVANCFSMGAIRSAEGAFLLGVMAPHTARAGSIYFPAGTPEPSDILGDKVDLENSLVREIEEETGIIRSQLVPTSGWFAVVDGQLVAMVRIMQANEFANVLRDRILGHLAGEKAPELSDIRIVRGRGDFDPMMPPYTVAFLAHAFGE